ncbi:NAD+ synthase [uncultured Thiodictyon sp.]|uniref:NAD+ synthase n=1 Tax=uncultured Thiodictyon sp. TaxID=1846217 RepID=UPI0025DEE878|nr:NAD+ synthase [uncultured Thiodictyon sp.]
MIRIGLAQTNPTVGDITGNLEQVLAAADQATTRQVRLLAYPELSLIGYPPRDLLFDPRLLSAQDGAIARLAEYARRLPITLVLGAVTANRGLGKPLLNSLLVIDQGRIVRRYHKQLLPTYDVFDERRYFDPGPRDPAILDLAGYRIGLLVCEDGWNYQGRDYAVDPLGDLAKAGADLAVSINASPFHVGKPALRAATLLKAGLPLAYVNQVGGNDELVFDGNSFFADGGTIRTRGRGFRPDLVVADFDQGQFTGEAPLTCCAEEEMFGALTLGLRDYMAKTGFRSVVVGSSGGIDSALVIAVSALALGPENVVAITMPSQYSSDGSISDSADLCQRLRVELRTHPIENIVQAFHGGYSRAMHRNLAGLAAENLQARVRGAILMEYANDLGALLVSTGNKSEMSVGYCTLYGDTNGGIGLIGDLYKTEVYRLARWINDRFGSPIPVAIIDKAPSAELAPGQRDSDSLPSYEVLDPLLREILEGEPLADLESDVALRERIEGMLARAEFKRRQAPPIIKVHARSFGGGRQMPIAARYARTK